MLKDDEEIQKIVKEIASETGSSPRSVAKQGRETEHFKNLKP
jgi:hypothetical protein